MSDKGYDVILFAPFAGIRPHARLERRVANALVEAGANVILVTCSGLLESRCTVMESRELKAGADARQRKAICASCTASLERLNDEVPLLCDTIDIASLLHASDKHLAEQIFTDFETNPSPNFEWSGIPFGAFWTYETILKYKSEEPRPEFIEHLTETAKSGSLSFVAGRRLAQEHAPSAVFLHSFEYAINRSFLYAFDNQETLKLTFFNAGQLSEWERGFRVERVGTDGAFADTSRVRDIARTAPLATLELNALQKWFDDRVDQRSALVYSMPRSRLTPREVRSRLGVDDKRVVLALSSSPDERQAATLARLTPSGLPPYDPDEQFAFARLVSETARDNPDIAFVYRLHPRLAPNRRDSQRSPLLDKLLSCVGGEDRPNNLVLNLPSQDLSLHDVAMIANAGLNWSSTAGLELLALGIPVVGINGAVLNAYPSTLHSALASMNPGGVSHLLRTAMRDGWSLEHMRQSARFIVSFVERTVIPVHVSDPPSPPASAGSLVRALRSHLPDPLLRSLAFFARPLVALAAASPSAGQAPPPNTGSAIEAGEYGWSDLTCGWIDWCRIPASEPGAEDQVLRAFAKHMVKRLGPWDGSEGALRELREFASTGGEARSIKVAR